MEREREGYTNAKGDEAVAVGYGHEEPHSVEHHSVAFTLTLHEMTPEAFTEEKRAHFTYDLASNLAVQPSQVPTLVGPSISNFMKLADASGSYSVSQ